MREKNRYSQQKETTPSSCCSSLGSSHCQKPCENVLGCFRHQGLRDDLLENHPHVDSTVSEFGKHGKIFWVIPSRLVVITQVKRYQVGSDLFGLFCQLLDLLGLLRLKQLVWKCDLCRETFSALQFPTKNPSTA